ncbi:hypothetical protein HK099_002640 [Clydaea vesicula]|uniref:Uncharacterized protein n=1 Tax=Clydaea vesicula TaxID=447962 RepID=A0AAD5U8H6_9FUNG|nr:hypothetical protein HK099_002640 [Clydaea vesicula]
MAVDIKLWAFGLINQFLIDNNLLETAQKLSTEAADIMEDLPNMILPEHSVNRSLLSILETYQCMNLSNSLQNVKLEKALDVEVLVKPNGAFPKKQEKIFDLIHNGNVLCCKIFKVPLATFPDQSSDDIPQFSTFKVLVTSGTDKLIKFTNLTSGKLIIFFNHHSGSCLDFDQHPVNLNLILTCGMDGTHHLLDLTTCQVRKSWSDHKKYVTGVKFSLEGNNFATASYDKSVNIYREDGTADYSLVHKLNFGGMVERDNCLHQITMGGNYSHSKTNMNENQDDWVSFTPMHLEGAPSGNHILVYTDSQAGMLTLVRKNGGQVCSFYGTSVDGFSQPRCCFDKSGAYIFATSDDKIFVYEVFSGTCVYKLSGHKGLIRNIFYDIESGALVSCSFDGTVRLWR